MQKHVLLPLTAAVLAAHVGLLWSLPALLPKAAAQERAALEFATRNIAPAAPAASPPPPEPKAVKKPRPPAPPKPTVGDAPAPSNPAASADERSDPPEPTEPTILAETTAAEIAHAALRETLQDVQLAAADSPAQDADLQVQLPAPARLSYEVWGQAKRFDYRARGELLWQHDGHSYQARQEIKAFLIGARVQTSRGQINASGLIPEHFSDQGRSEKTIDFDFAAQQARFNTAAPPAAIGPGAQDRLSVFLQLSALVAASPELYPPGSEITFTTVGSNYAERWTFRVQGHETLELPRGTLATLKLERLPRHAQDQQAALWLAPALGYLPARIRLTQANGDFADLQLQSHAAP